MQTSIQHTVGIIGAIVSAVCLIAASLVFVAAILKSAARNHVREDRPNDGSFGLPLEAILPEEIFAVPMTADPVAVRAVLGETHCYGCVRPTSECGVLRSITMRFAKAPSWLCDECAPLYRRHALDVSDMAISATVPMRRHA